LISFRIDATNTGNSRYDYTDYFKNRIIE
jgi:hypothetical protein